MAPQTARSIVYVTRDGVTRYDDGTVEVPAPLHRHNHRRLAAQPADTLIDAMQHPIVALAESIVAAEFARFNGEQ